MDQTGIKILQKNLGTNRLLFNEPLKNHTYFHQEMNSSVYFEAQTAQDLEISVSTAIENKIPFYIIGSGANTFFSPKLDNSFLLIKNCSRNIFIKGFRTTVKNSTKYPEVLVQCDSGTTLSMLARFCQNENISGLEFCLKIPGTVGAALKQNVAIMPTVKNIIGNYLFLAQIIDFKTGQKKLVGQDYFEFDYHYSALQKNRDIVISVVFKLPKVPLHLSPKHYETATRPAPHNQQLVVTGPIFKNIPYREAVRLSTRNLTLSPSYLIQKLNLPGHTIGNVVISSENPNSFILQNDYQVEDIGRMIRFIKRQVKVNFNITLFPLINLVRKPL